MFVPFSGSGNYELHNLTPYNNRCTIDSGGYYIKDGVCYFDMVVTMLVSTSNQNTILNFPTRKSTANMEYFSAYNLSDSSIKANFYITPASENAFCSSTTKGYQYRVYGVYETTDADI